MFSPSTYRMPAPIAGRVANPSATVKSFPNRDASRKWSKLLWKLANTSSPPPTTTVPVIPLPPLPPI